MDNYPGGYEPPDCWERRPVPEACCSECGTPFSEREKVFVLDYEPLCENCIREYILEMVDTNLDDIVQTLGGVIRNVTSY